MRFVLAITQQGTHREHCVVQYKNFYNQTFRSDRAKQDDPMMTGSIVRKYTCL